jgi:hypothetical protein
MNSSTNTANHWVLSTDSTTTRGHFEVSESPDAHRTVRSQRNVENAVYGYIRAVRALGRTKISTAEVARALALSVSEVNSVLASLKGKGVRASNG